MATIRGSQNIHNIWIIETDVDPSLGGGTPAPLGSLALASDGSGTFTKIGANDTDWIDSKSAVQWMKVTKSFADFSAASTNKDIEIYSLPAGYMIQGVVIKHSTNFTGGALASYTISVGVAGDLTKYASAFNVSQAASDTTLQTSNNFTVENWGASTSIRAEAISTGANLNAATQGVVEFYLLISKVKY